jgi:hypothetical protein
MVNISIEISEDIYEKLEKMGHFFENDPETIIKEILDAVSLEENLILDYSKNFQQPDNIKSAIVRLLNLASHSRGYLEEKILRALDVLGCYVLGDFGIYLDEKSIHFHYDLVVSNLLVDIIVLYFSPGEVALYAWSYIDMENKDKDYIRKIKEIVKGIETDDDSSLPEELQDSRILGIDLINEEDEFPYLQIEIEEESLGDLPSIKPISSLFQQIYDRANT